MLRTLNNQFFWGPERELLSFINALLASENPIQLALILIYIVVSLLKVVMVLEVPIFFP